MKRSVLLALTAALLLPMAAAADTYTASLTPDAVVPDPGPAGATGFAVVTLSGTTVSYQVIVSGLDGLTAAHIHQGAAGASGGVVVDLAATFAAGTATGSVTADAATVAAILAAPADYYVQVHTSANPAGALRGQLGGGADQGATLYFPVVAAIQGLAGTNFLTDGRFVNLSGGAASVTMEYYAEGAAGHTEPTATATATIPAGAELVLDDLVATQFGVTDGKGAMVVRADREITGLARVYNDQTAAGEGTFGQLVRGLPMAAAYSSGLLPFLSNQAAASGAGYRANIGWFNPSASPVTVTLTGYDDDGTMLGRVDHTAAGWAMEQVNVATLWPALADYGDFYVTYETAGDASLFMYASVVDNVNGDAIYVAASPAN